MRLRFRAEVAFVVPLDLGQAQQVRHEVAAAREDGETSRILVLAHISALESARSVHRDEPSANAA